MKILVACEFSGTVRDAFIARGHDAWSCDLELTENQGPHFQDDIFHVLAKPLWRWDLMIAHPPCTYLCNSGVKHLYLGGKKENGPDQERWENMRYAAEFVAALWAANVEKVVIENPIMHGHGKNHLRKIGCSMADTEPQIIQPWQFGHREMKATCLWMRGVDALAYTDIVGPPPKDKLERRSWAKVHRASPGPNRWKDRSRTLPGIANALADQIGGTDLMAAA